MFKRLVQRIGPFSRQAWPLLVNRRIGVRQPDNPSAKIVITLLQRTRINVDGKVTLFEFMPAFLRQLRSSGLATSIVLSEADLEREMRGPIPKVLVNIFGEDSGSIVSPRLEQLEAEAAMVFNRAAIGPLLADKLDYHHRLVKHGVAVPELLATGGFVRERRGTMMPTSLDQPSADNRPASDSTIRTAFIDTRVTFAHKTYFTTVRLLCIDDVVLHAYTRARAEGDGDPSVHAKDTPRDPELIEYLHRTQVQPRIPALSHIASQLHEVLGNGFFVHDLLVDQSDGQIMVCESGIKFDDMAYWKHVAPLAAAIPSQAPLLPVQTFAERSARVFAERCRIRLG